MGFEVWLNPILFNCRPQPVAAHVEKYEFNFRGVLELLAP